MPMQYDGIRPCVWCGEYFGRDGKSRCLVCRKLLVDYKYWCAHIFKTSSLADLEAFQVTIDNIYKRVVDPKNLPYDIDYQQRRLLIYLSGEPD